MLPIRSCTLRDGSQLSIFRSDGLSESPATPLLLKTYAELIQDGFTIENFIGFKNTSSMIWAEIDDKVVGGICFESDHEMSYQWIVLSFTHPDFRGRGINAECHKILENHARTNKLRYIGSHVHVNNESRLRSAKKVGLEPAMYVMHKKL